MLIWSRGFPQLLQVKWVWMVTYVCKISNHCTTSFNGAPCSVLCIHRNKVSMNLVKQKEEEIKPKSQQWVPNQRESSNKKKAKSKNLPQYSVWISWTRCPLWRPQKQKPMEWRIHTPPPQEHSQQCLDPTINQTRLVIQPR